MRTKSLTAVLLFFFCVSAQLAQAASNYLFYQSRVTSELSQVSVEKVFQDSEGFLWFLTKEGINRFDGKDTVVFRADIANPYAISSNYLTSIAEDSEGNLWFGTERSGLARLSKRDYRFTAFKTGGEPSASPLSNQIRAISEYGPNELLISYNSGGFSLFHPGLGRFKHYTPQQHPLLEGLVITAFFEQGDGRALVGTDTGGVLEFNVDNEEFTPLSNRFTPLASASADNVFSVHEDQSGDVWIGTSDSGVYRVSKDGGVSQYTAATNVRRDVSIGFVEVYDFLEYSNGTMFLATNSGVAQFDRATDQLIVAPIRGQDSIPFRMLSIIEDKTGLIWVGGFSGVFTGFEPEFRTLAGETGLEDENILSVAVGSDGQLLLGTSSSLDVFSVGGGAQVGRLLHDTPVTSMLSEKDHLWVGTYLAGLIRIDRITGERLQYAMSAPSPRTISDDQITSIFRDAAGNLWVGTYNGGLNLMKAGSNSFRAFRADVSDPDSISSNVIYAVFQEKSGDVWVGTDQGLNRYDPDTGGFEVFLNSPDQVGALSSPTVMAIHEDDKARLWIGTLGGGLNMWEPVDRKRSLNRFSYFQSNIDLNSSSIWAIQGDDDGNIWLATSVGLTRYNFERNESKTFTVEDGLQSNEFNFGASYRDANGKLYFGGTSGLNFFQPDEIRSNAPPPTIALTGIKLGNESVWFDVPYSQLEEIELQPDDYLLGISFAAMDFRAPHRNQYRYQMVGLDQNWVELGNRNYIDFSKLPMGEYVLRIQGSNPDGVWSPEGIRLNVVVHPPIYFTWYAFIVYFAIAMLLVAMVFYRQRQKAQEQLAYQMQLEEDVRARTLDLRRSNDKLQVAVEEMGRARQEAELANQAKSEFLAALSHEIRTPMHGVLGMTDLLLHSGLNDRQQNFAESAHVSANELLGLIDNILDFSKIEAGKLELEETTFDLRELLENLCYLYGELAQAKNLELNLVFNVDLRRQLYGDPVRLRQILQNLLSNAIKFTKRGSVNLLVDEVQRENRSVQIRFQVEDTGIGMNEETVERVFEAFSQADSSTTRQFGGTGLGLSIAKQLIDLMSGELDVKSRSGVGTTMSVDIAFPESPIYTDPIHADGVEGFYAEIAAPVPETRAMFQSQLESLGMKVRQCATVEELASVAEQDRVVLVDVGCLYNGASITLVENMVQDTHTRLLLVTPLSGQGVPPELEHLPHTTKPVRLASLISDIHAAGDKASERSKAKAAPLLRFEKHLLLVEDIPANQQIARAMLESFGCSVAVARNGEVALDMFQQDEFDLVLMDCQMPVMDGFEATRHIRQYEMQRGGSQRTPVVALTAGKTESEKERCYASGMDRILFKPYSSYDLNDLLSNYFIPVGQVERAQATKPAAQPKVDILDMKALENIRTIEIQTGGDLLAAVIENFRVDGEQKLTELQEALGDSSALSAGAHAIKSMSLNLGAKALSEYCRYCEAKWKGGEIDKAEREVEILAGHFRDAAAALQELLSQESEVGE